jgi:hypothetical protein
LLLFVCHQGFLLGKPGRRHSPLEQLGHGGREQL